MTDRELLELAARAAGYERNSAGPVGPCDWNPLTDDGDALRLAVKLDMIVTVNRVDGRTEVSCGYCNADLVSVQEPHGDPYAATRRAIVRAAAAIAQQEKGND